MSIARLIFRMAGGVVAWPIRLRARTPIAYHIGLGLLICAFVAALFFKYYHDGYESRIDAVKIQSELGRAYVVSLQQTVPFPWLFHTIGDTNQAPKKSGLKLFENGKPLGPAHAVHDQIRGKGSGRYSHWGDFLYFSATDNTDPRTNGRDYTAIYAFSVRRQIYVPLFLIVLYGLLPFGVPTARNFTSRLIRQREQTSRRAEEPVGEGAIASGVPPSTDLSTPLKAKSRLPGFVRSTIAFLVVAGVTIFGFEYASYMYLKVASGLPQEKFIPHLHSPYRGHRLKPSGEYAGPGHSPDGFRRDEAVSMIKLENTMRIFLMGGSTVYGIGAGGAFPSAPPLTNDEGIDRQLEIILNAGLKKRGQETRIEVINAGLVGYHTFQHLIYINESLVHYKPDFFIFLDGHNDFYQASEGYNHWLAYPYYSVTVSDLINQPTVLYGSYLLFKALPQQSSFVTLVHRMLHKKVQIAVDKMAQNRGHRGKTIPPEKLKERYSIYAENTYLRAYRQIRTVAEQIGAGMMIFIQPEVVLESPDNLSPVDANIRNIAASNWNGYAATMARIHALIMPAILNAGFESYDLGTIGDKADTKEQLYIDYAHLTPRGAQVVAKKMAKKLWPHVLDWTKSNAGNM